MYNNARSKDEPMRHKVLALALRGGEHILRKRTETTMGVRFPAEPLEGNHKRYEYKLYDGAAGIGIILLDLAKATNDDRYAKLCSEVSHGLIESTPAYGPLSVGLYNGFSGVALFHLARAKRLLDTESLKYAVHLGKRLAQSPLIDTDLFRGAAGAGLLQIAFFYATQDETFLQGAKRAASFLAETAIVTEAGTTWTVRDPRQSLTAQDESYAELALDRHAGLAHGVAGICLFLVQLANIFPDQSVIQLYQNGFRWLESKAQRTANTISWPRSDRHPVFQNHWCHGSAGIAHAYLARHLYELDDRMQQTAEAAGEAVWQAFEAHADEPPYHCHGFSGALDLFLELASHSGNELWLKRAYSVFNRLEQTTNGDPSLGVKDTGLGLGTAGIVRQLLRLASHPVFPILVADRDLQIQASSEVDSPKTHERSGMIDSKMAQLIPRVGIKFKQADRYVELGQAAADLTQSFLHELRNRPAGISYFRAVRRVTHACDRLIARYPQMIAQKALRVQAVGAILREIAAIAIHPRTDPERVIRTARRMITTTIRSLELLLQRLEKDRSGVLAKEVGGKLTDVEVLRSDPHRGGQRVILLRFEEGPALLYKSRSVLIDRELAGASGAEERPTLADQCRQWLVPSVAGGILPAHRIIAADQWYGYVEQITNRQWAPLLPPVQEFDSEAAQMLPLPITPQVQEGDEKRFWYSAGLVAGHAFSFGIRDLHAENVICGQSMSTPRQSMHLVDLELSFGSVLDLEDTQLLDGPRWETPAVRESHSHAGFHPNISFGCGLHAEEWLIQIDQTEHRLVPYPWRGCRWIFPHQAQNSDGSIGYRNHLCVFLRGFADQWQLLQKRSHEISNHLRTTLAGVPARIVCKPTLSYIAALMQRKIGSPPIPGAASHHKLPFAMPLLPAELRQLNQLDIPYFFRFLEDTEDSHRAVYWMQNADDRYFRVRNFPAVDDFPFYDVLERQSDPKRLARAVVDAVWAVAPNGPFDQHVPQLGVRVVRTAEDPRMWIIILLGERHNQRLTCRVANEGKIEWWLD